MGVAGGATWRSYNWRVVNPMLLRLHMTRSLTLSIICFGGAGSGDGYDGGGKSSGGK